MYSIQGVILESEVSYAKPVANAIVSVGDLCDTTNADGAYFIGNVKNGCYEVKVTHPQYAFFHAIVAVDQNIKMNFKITRVFTLQGEIREKSRIGTIPIQGATISVGSSESCSDVNGKYSIGDLFRGDYPLKITRTGYYDYDSTITICNDTTMNFYLDKRGYFVQGKIFEDSEFATMPIVNAVIQIGDVKDTTNSAGNYNMTLQNPGDYTVNITHPYYFDINTSTTISFSDTTINDYVMDPILDDYFPLEVGNIWNYEFNVGEYWGGGNYYVNYKGISTWEIIGKEEKNDLIIYKVLHEFNGIYKNFIDYPYETIDIASDTTYFQIEEDQDNIVQIKDFPAPYQPTWDHPIYSPIQRYQPMRLPDTLICNFGTMVFIVNIGLSRTFYPTAAYHYWHEWDLKLIDFNGK